MSATKKFDKLMQPQAGPRAKCNCRHLHNEHENHKTWGLGNGPCAWSNCKCTRFDEAPPEPRQPRIKPIKPLDSDEPKLFEVEK